MKLPSDSDHHPRYGEKHPGTERSVEIGFDADDADLSQGHGEHDEEGRTDSQQRRRLPLSLSTPTPARISSDRLEWPPTRPGVTLPSSYARRVTKSTHQVTKSPRRITKSSH